MPFLAGHDIAVKPEWAMRCVALDEYLIVEYEGEAVGFLRFSLFWGGVPFLDMVNIDERYRRQGWRTALFERWQADMMEGEARLLMTSAMSNEAEPQAFHRHNGFVESGQVTFGKQQTIPEIFFVKDLPYHEPEDF